MNGITFPIGNDSFRDIRRQQNYYVDKTMFISDFIKLNIKVSLITRPRRFGKSLNMTMLREFFDITKDSHDIFNNLAIMESEYRDLMNSRPVVFLTFKNCRGSNVENLRLDLIRALQGEYKKYADIVGINNTYESTYAELWIRRIL